MTRLDAILTNVTAIETLAKDAGFSDWERGIITDGTCKISAACVLAQKRREAMEKLAKCGGDAIAVELVEKL